MLDVVRQVHLLWGEKAINTIDKVYLERSMDMSLTDHAAPLNANQLDLTPAPQNDTVARFLAYTSPYLFWGTLGVLSLGIFLIR